MISNRRNRMPLTLVSPGCTKVGKYKCWTYRRRTGTNVGLVVQMSDQ